MHHDACVWCGKLVTTPQPPNCKQDVVCSDRCKQYEHWFRSTYSDKNIGEQNYRNHGVNPNHLGGRHGKRPTKG